MNDYVAWLKGLSLVGDLVIKTLEIFITCDSKLWWHLRWTCSSEMQKKV